MFDNSRLGRNENIDNGCGVKGRLRLRSIMLFISVVLLFISCAASPNSSAEQYDPAGRPLAPRNLKATNGYEGKITLTWDQVNDAYSYSVWKIPSDEYGSISAESIVDDSNIILWLSSRGFKHLGDTTSTTYEDTSRQSESFVYTVVAIKKADESNSNLLYSNPSAYAEGSTLRASESIDIDAIGNEAIINIFWSVPNMYSVLSDSQKVLYEDYSFTVKYKKTTEADWKEAASGIKATEYQLSCSAFALSPDTNYNVMVEAEIYAGGSVVNEPFSRTYTVKTDSSLVPAPMKSVAVSKGTLNDGIEVSWEYPDIPSDVIGYDKGYQIERLESGRWIVVLKAEDCTPNATSWIDYDAEYNTQYKYRVKFAYMSTGGSANISQSDSDTITESEEAGWIAWMPEEIKVTSSDVKGDAPSQTRTISISWKYSVPEADESIWKILINDWSQNDGKVKTTEHTDISGSSASFDITVDDTAYHYFTFDLIQTINGKERKHDVSGDENELISFNEKIAKLESFEATDDFVGVIRLTWTMKDGMEISNDTSVSISRDNGEYKVINGYINTNPGIYYYDDPVDDGKPHSYRIRIGETFYSEVADGDVLRAPSSISASDGEYNDKILVTFDASGYSSKIKYKVKYGDKEIEVADGYSDGLEIPAEKNTTDGTVYDISVSVANADQENGKWSEYSPVDKGNVLGGGGMNVTAAMYEDPEEFHLQWENPAVGATRYVIYVLQDDGKYGSISGSPTSSDTEYSFGYSGVIDTRRDYPLSEVYTFKLVPKRDSIEADLESVEPVQGALFCPPKNISASKGKLSNGIEVTWDAVKNATGYRVYKAKIDSGEKIADKPIDSFSFVADVSRSESYRDNSSTDGEYAYLVTSVKDDGNTESLMQDPGKNPFPMETTMYREEEEINRGYPLMACTDLTADSVVSNGKYEDYVKVQWKRSKGATGYRLSNNLIGIYDNDLLIDVSKIDYSQDNPSNGIEGIGHIEYDKNTKMYTYYDGRGIRKESAEISGYTIQASYDNSHSNQTYFGNSVTRQLNAYECINLVNAELNYHLNLANGNDYINGDWFPYGTGGTQRKYPKDDVDLGIKILSAKGGGIYSNVSYYADGRGYIELQEYKPRYFDGFTLKTGVGYEAAMIIWPENPGNYLGSNRLEYIGYTKDGEITSNSVEIIPDDDRYFNATVTYNDISLLDYDGYYEVKIGDASSDPIYWNAENSPMIISPWENQQ